MKFFLLPIYAFLLNTSLHAQSSVVIDSLEKELQKNIPDSAKVYILTQIDWEYRVTDKQKALDYANKALTLATKINFTEGIGFSYMAIGNVHSYYRDYPVALENYQKALAVFEKSNLKLRMAQVYDNIGFTYSKFSHSEEAILYLQKALDIYVANNIISHIGGIYNVMGGIYEENLQFDKAIEFRKKALQIAIDQNEYEDAAMAYNDLYGSYKSLYEQRKENFYLDSCLLTLNSGYKIVQNHRISYQPILPALLCNLGYTHYLMGNYPAAIDYTKQSIAIAVPLSFDDVICEGNGTLGDIFFHQKKYDSAEYYLKKSLEAAKRTNVDYLSGIYERLHTLYAAKGDFMQAFNYQTLYISAKDSLYNIQKTETVNNLQIRYETEKKEQQIQYLQKENSLKNKTNKALILLSVLLVGLSLLIYRNFKLKKKVFSQKEKLLKEEKEVSVLQSKIEEKAKEDALLKIQLQHQEQQRLQQEIDFKHRELTANMLQIEQKNELLSDLKSQLQYIESNHKTLNLNLKSTYQLIENSIEIDEDIEKFIKHFEQVHPDFFAKLQQTTASTLSQLDMKYCAYMRMQLNTKEIAQMLNIEPKSIRMARYRLKKKLNLPEETDLINFISKL